jgi:hypothetical protein
MFKSIIKKINMLFFILLLSACAVNCSKNSDSTLKDGDKNPIKIPVELSRKSEAAACINGDRAMEYVKKVVSFAPRHAGTPGLEETRKYIETTLRSLGLTPVRDNFIAHTPDKKIGDVELANIYTDIGDVKNSDGFFILSGHFDGKIIESGTFYGANDGGSSTALLIEMAACLKKHPLKVPVRVLFFDGEEALVKWTDSDSLYGSKHYVSYLAEQGLLKKIKALINIDMVGDSNLRYTVDTNSNPKIMNALMDSAGELHYDDLFVGRRGAIGDDHIPFVEMGVPAAVLIDFNFGPGFSSNSYWHTSDDNLSHVSAKSLTQTGQIVLLSLTKL